MLTELEVNRIRRIENQVNAITANLILLNTDVAELVDEIYQCYDATSTRAVELGRKAQSIRNRAEALRSLTPNR